MHYSFLNFLQMTTLGLQKNCDSNHPVQNSAGAENRSPIEKMNPYTGYW
jgi:hypothetical protein